MLPKTSKVLVAYRLVSRIGIIHEKESDMHIITKNKLKQVAMDEILKQEPRISSGNFAKAFNKKMEQYRYILENL